MNDYFIDKFHIKYNQLMRGKEFWTSVVTTLGITENDMVIILAEEEKKVNIFALKYLAAVKEKHGIDRIFIFGRNLDDYQTALSYSSSPAFFYQMKKDDSEGLNLINRLYKFTNRIIYCNPNEISDKNIFLLADSGKVNIEDIVAVGIFSLDGVPEEDDCLHDGNIKEVFLDEKIPIITSGNIFERKTMIDGLEDLVCSERISQNDKIVIFGVNGYTETIIEILGKYRIQAIIDNNQTKWGHYVNEIRICSPEEILKTYDKNYKIIIASGHFREMTDQLKNMGYSEGKDVFVIETRKNQNDEKLQMLERRIRECYKGYLMYCQWMKRFPNTYLFYNRRATGNTFLLGIYLPVYMEKHNIKKYLVLNEVKACHDICNLFGIHTVYLEDKNQACHIWEFSKLMGNSDIGFREMCPYDYTTRLFEMRIYKGLNFGIIYRHVLYEYDGYRNPDNLQQETADLFFNKFDLKKGNTVLLSPYANTVQLMNEKFWTELAKRLKEKGYDVCTNCGFKEKEVKGTKGLCLPYKNVIDFVNQAGYFIGVRSGLCDIVHTSKGKMVVLYPNDNDYRYFSIEKVYGRTEELLEIFHMGNSDIYDKIFSFFDL